MSWSASINSCHLPSPSTPASSIPVMEIVSAMLAMPCRRNPRTRPNSHCDWQHPRGSPDLLPQMQALLFGCIQIASDTSFVSIDQGPQEVLANIAALVDASDDQRIPYSTNVLQVRFGRVVELSDFLDGVAISTVDDHRASTPARSVSSASRSPVISNLPSPNSTLPSACCITMACVKRSRRSTSSASDGTCVSGVGNKRLSQVRCLLPTPYPTIVANCT